MNVAKNKTSALKNLFIIIQGLNNHEIELFSKFLKEKRKRTKNDYLLNYIVNLIKDGYILDTLDESSIKKEFLNTDKTTNFNKLVENLYSKLLIFISKQFKKDNWKKWQLEANQKLLEIEALSSRKHYSQAKAEIKRLENNIKKNKKFQECIYDDITIYSRLAHLKINLKRFNEKIYSIDETDNLLHNLLQTGQYFYNNQLKNSNMHSFDEHRLLGYSILAKYFQGKNEFSESISSIDNVEIAIRNGKNFDNYSKNVLLDYFNLLKIFLQIRNGETSKIENQMSLLRRNTIDPTLISTMLNEFMIKEIKQVVLKNDSLNNKVEQNLYIDLLFYSSDQINNIPYRLEMNTAILMYIKNNYKDSLLIIKVLKSKKDLKSRTNHLFLELLFFELLCKKNDLEKNGNDYDLHALLDNSINPILRNRNELIFEKKATKILRKWLDTPSFSMSEFPKDNKDKLDQMEVSIMPTETMNNIILQTLRNEI